jgi:ribosomal protein L7/L12
MSGYITMDDLRHHFGALSKRLEHMETQLALVSEKAGVAYAPYTDGVPQHVKDLAQGGNTLEAIKAYREATGADLETARGVVVGL